MIKGDQKARQNTGVNNLHLLCLQRAWETGKAQWLRGFQADPFQSSSKNSGSEQKNADSQGRVKWRSPDTYMKLPKTSP